MAFEFDFTLDKLAGCINNPAIENWYDTIIQTLPEYNITSINRVAAWLAQMGHESADFRTLVENLNYSAQALRRTWPRHFPTDAIAQQYHRQPERIANRAYANRMGNGPESSGDGWKYRGRGIIQITGKSNYTNCSMALYGDAQILLDEPQILCEVDGAVRSACWFWNSRDINDPADSQDIVEVTRRINGGTHGLDDRQKRYHRALAVLSR